MNAAESVVLAVAKVVDVDAHEGPVYVADERALYFTSVPRPRPYVAVRRLDLGTLEVATVLDGANAANGMTLDRHARLLVGLMAALPRRGSSRRDSDICVLLRGRELDGAAMAIAVLGM